MKMKIILILMTLSANFAFAEEMIKVEAVDTPIVYTTVGTIRSRDEIEISPRITARIIEMKKRSGDTVKKDEVIIQLDSEDLKAVKNRLEAQLTKAEADLKLAKTEYERAAKLFKSNAVSKRTLDEAEKSLQSAMSGLTSLKREIEHAEANLSYATIISPFDGIIAERFSDPGDMAAPSKVLLKVFDPTKLMLYASISESIVKEIKVGKKVDIYINALKKNIPGVVSEIVPSVDETSRTFTVKVLVDPDKNLMPGMFGTFSLPIGTRKEIIIPEKAVTRIGQLEYVTVIDKDKNRKKILIRTVPAKDGKRKVISGFKPHSLIILQND